MSDKKQCNAENSRGERCRAFANESGVCFMHDATKGKERASARRNGGLATKQPHYADATVLPSAIRDISSVLIILDYALQESVGLDNSIQRGQLLVSIAHGYIEALKVGELEQRLKAVENAMNLRKQNK
ncbi:MAG TPA: hypothetical protein VF556_08740 [Pyrinomonadaceae bacterium]|jgi:hypothetical protein